MQHRRVLIFFTPNTDPEQKRALSVVCALLCTQKTKRKEEKSMILFLLFMLPLLWSHLRFGQHPHACSYWLQPSLRLDIEHIRYPVFVRPSQMSARTSQ